MDAATQRVFFSSDALTFFSEHMGVQGLRSAACKLGQKRYAFLRKKKERPRKPSNAENVGNVLSIGIRALSTSEVLPPFQNTSRGSILEVFLGSITSKVLPHYFLSHPDPDDRVRPPIW